MASLLKNLENMSKEMGDEKTGVEIQVYKC